MRDPRHYAVQETLRNGIVVTIRAPQPGDGEKIHTAFKNLEAETIYTRFFGFRSEVSDAELKRITDADFKRNGALLVTLATADNEIVIGGGSYFTVDSDEPGRGAEVAFTVEEDYQGLGIAGNLMRHLIAIARDAGFTRLEADILKRNLPMLAVFRRSGLPMTLRSEDDAVHVTLTLTPVLE